MASTAVYSMVVVLLLLIHVILLLPLFVFLCFGLFCCAILNVLLVLNHLTWKVRAVCCILIAFLMLCGCSCSVSLPRAAVGWSAVCCFGISWSYSITFSKCKMHWLIYFVGLAIHLPNTYRLATLALLFSSFKRVGGLLLYHAKYSELFRMRPHCNHLMYMLFCTIHAKLSIIIGKPMKALFYIFVQFMPNIISNK